MGTEIYSSGLLVSSGSVFEAEVIASKGNNSMYIGDGGTASDTVVLTGGTVFVSSGGSMDNTLMSGGGLIISGGEVVNNSISGGNVYVFDGGVVSNTSAGDGFCYIYVSSGGAALGSNVVGSKGNLHIYSGGIAENVDWTPCVGKVEVDNGAVVNFVSTYSGVYFGSDNQLLEHSDIIDGKVFSGNLISYNSAYVMSGGILTNAVMSGGRVYIGSDGVASNMNISNGSVFISSGGTVSNADISGGRMVVSGGGVVDGGVLNSGGSMVIMSGGSAVDLTWTPCIGTLTVSSGAYVTYASAHSGIYLGSNNFLDKQVQNIDGAVVSGKNKLMYVMSDGVAENTCVSRGSMYIHDGGTADKTLVSAGGRMYVLNGANATETTVDDGGSMYISQGGNAADITVSSGGIIFIYDAGEVSDLTVEVGGQLGGFAFNTVKEFAAITGSAVQLAPGVTISGSDMLVDNGGIFDSGSVQDGTLTVAYGGVVSSVAVRGVATVYGTAEDVDIDFGGRVDVFGGGFFSGGTIDNGVLTLNGGTAAGTLIKNGGAVMVSRGCGIVDAEVVSGAGIYVGNEASAYNIEITASGTLNVSSGGSVYGNKVGKAGILNVFSGGTAENVEWTPCVGNVYIEDGATVSFTSSYSGVYFGSGGKLVSSAASMTGKEVSDQVNYHAEMYVMANGAITDMTVGMGGNLFVSSGIADNTEVVSGGKMQIRNGGLAADNSVSDAAFEVFSGGTAQRTVLTKDAEMTVYDGGSAAEVEISSSGKMFVSSGALIDTVTVSSGGMITVGLNASVSGLELLTGALLGGFGFAEDLNLETAENGRISIADGVTVVDSTMTVDHGYIANVTVGGQMVISGGIVYENTVVSGGQMVISGGIVYENTVVSGGQMVVSGGTAGKTEVVSGGRIVVSEEVVMYDTLISSGGIMNISSGGVFNGTLDIKDGGSVNVAEGGVVNIDIAGKPMDLDFSIRNITAITGAPEFVLTVNADQAVGEYKIADGAADFAGSFMVMIEGETVGSIQFGESTLFCADRNYELTKSDDGLYVKVYGSIGDEFSSSSALSWSVQPDTADYVLEYYQNGSDKPMQLIIPYTAVDLFGVSGGDYQWRVKPVGCNIWLSGDSFNAPEKQQPQQFESVKNDVMDIFFAVAHGVWEKEYQAQHFGSLNDGTAEGWSGTNTLVNLHGKNIIADVFAGSDDANVLVLTDDENGDALFIDDVFSAFGDDVRLSDIKEIRAGSGDDVVDLTSLQYVYNGDKTTVYGGDGDDVIWANRGSNVLFGDAGNDSIIGGIDDDIIVGGGGDDVLHGGCGNDIFVFGGDWGNDTVEQSGSGTVTLWFESYDETNWSEQDGSRVYTQGQNSITILGDIALEICTEDTDPEKFAELSAMGAFENCASKKIFDGDSTGWLA